MNNDLISREALKAKMKEADAEAIDYEMLVAMYEKLVNDAPTVPLPNEQIAWEQGYEAGLAQGKQDRPKGEWKKLYGNHTYCSKCKKDCEQNHINFCGYCGADMR